MRSKAEQQRRFKARKQQRKNREIQEHYHESENDENDDDDEDEGDEDDGDCPYLIEMEYDIQKYVKVEPKPSASKGSEALP